MESQIQFNKLYYKDEVNNVDNDLIEMGYLQKSNENLIHDL